MAIHINSAGEPGQCSAVNGRCPFGGMDVHFTTVEAARNAYETRQAGSFSAKLIPPGSAADRKKALLARASATLAGEKVALDSAKSLGDLRLDDSARGSLSQAMDFYHVLAKGTDGYFYEGFNEVYGPDTSDIQDNSLTDAGQGWRLITSGLTQQYGYYKGPWLHESEQIAGGVARAVAEGKPGYYVAVVGTGYSDYDEEDYEPVEIGWSIAYKPFAPVTEALDYSRRNVGDPF